MDLIAKDEPVTNEQTLSSDALISNCEKERLHLSGHIQPFGGLLCFEWVTNNVTHMSINLSQFLPVDVMLVLGKPLKDSLIILFRSRPLVEYKTVLCERIFESILGAVDARLTLHNGLVLVELELSAINDAYVHSYAEYQHKLFIMPTDETELALYHQTLTSAIREITQFNRVMIYRFHADLSGEVISESTSESMGSYLGLRFPASDIPAIARHLYVLNPYRLINNINVAPLPILSYDNFPPDLTFSDLRSVSPVHVHYLHNMKVVASFAVSILISGKLWGLIICHHAKPAFVPLRDRERCATLARCYGLGLSYFESNRRVMMMNNLHSKVERVIEPVVASSHDIVKGLESGYQGLIEAVSAHGLIILFANQRLVVGETPDPESVDRLDYWFVKQNRESVATTDHLVVLLNKEISSSKSGGMMAIKNYSAKSGWVRLFWFRNALPQEVAWGRNPNKPIENVDTQALSPQHSFEKWVEIRTDYSRPWTEEDQAVAKMLRVGLLRWL